MTAGPLPDRDPDQPEYWSSECWDGCECEVCHPPAYHCWRCDELTSDGVVHDEWTCLDCAEVAL